MPITRSMRAACAVAVIAVAGLSGCGSDGPDSYTAPAPAVDTAGESEIDQGVDTTDSVGSAEVVATGETVEVKALDNTFIEEDVNVAVGTEVVWKNGGRNDHDIVPAVEAETWGVGVEAFRPGDSYSYTFAEPGEYAYYCTIHGTADVGMTGTIIVS